MAHVPDFSDIRRRDILRSTLIMLLGLMGYKASSHSLGTDGIRRIIDVTTTGAEGNGIADDRRAIQTAIDRLALLGGGDVVIPAGRFMLGSALIPRSRVTLRGVNRDRSILQAAPESLDNVVGIDYLVEGQVAAARRGKAFNRLSSPNFDTLSYAEARRTGGYAGYGVVDFHLRNLTIDGNKNNCAENANFLVTSRITGSFAPGQIIHSSSGGQAMVSATFPDGSPPGLSIRPSTITGTGRFTIGDEIVGPTGTMLLTTRRGDDAYQAGVVFHAATRCSMINCIIRNTVYHAVVVYNSCSLIEISHNIIRNPNKSDTLYKGGNVHIYCDFDNRAIRIVDNVLNGGGGYGIVVSETGGRTDDVLIAGNIISDTPGDAIRISSDSAVSSATIASIRLSRNRIARCGDTAIRLIHNGRDNSIIHPVVNDNQIAGARFGILLSGRIEHPQVHNNHFSNIAGVSLDLGFGPIDPTRFRVNEHRSR